MKRAIVFTFFVVMMITVISGCSAKSDTGVIDLEELAGDLLENVLFEDELNQVDDGIVKKLYNISNASEAYVYIGSGATAEEIAVFKFESEEDAKKAVELAEARISYQIESYKSYIPKEVKRLENAVIKQSGCYLVVCVSDGSEAEQIISKYIK